MVIGQQALGHAHGQIGNPAFLHQGANLVISLRVGGTLAEDYQGALGTLQDLEGTRNGVRRGQLARRGIDNLDQ